ncbi:leucine-rich repeat-containing protein 56-like isoform X5 [Bolinopsis microptera]|uniref:leucine-rich repeat-containing protein 56-like isoform X5 n=1 Tax=Bolinopsis microptera TaxID=2820187 RepID=UPI003078D318
MASLQHMPQCSSHSNGIRSVMHSDPVRPGTPSFRIVSTPAVNPSPTFSDAFEEEEVLFEDVLSPKKLRQLSGYSDLSHVISLDLIVDTSESSLGSLGNYLPNIRELRLSGSRISSVRDLGTTLRSLQVLWMSRCGLQDLDGIGSIGTLRELYLSYNEISDVSPLSMVDTLELVDIESNNVDSLDQIEFLCMCPNLSTLNIEGNPVTSLMSPVELRKKICVLLPELRYLDDQLLKGQLSGGSLTTSSHPLLGNTGNLQSEISVVNTSLKDTMSEAQRRPKSAKLGKSAKLEREDTSSSIPSPTPSPGIPPDHSSGLTQGAVICGPPSKLRTKLTKNVKENIYSDILEKSAPPTPVGAWSEDPDEMLQEWKTSRDWLSRELTIDSVNEENTKSEKRANYEAALRETSRPSSSRKLSRPTSAARKSPTNPSPVPKSGKSRTPTFYDESVDVEERADKRVARDNHVPKKSAREQRVGSGSREQRSGSQDRRSGSQDRRSGSLDRRSIDRSKGKERLSKNELCVKQFRTTKTKKIS